MTDMTLAFILENAYTERTITRFEMQQYPDIDIEWLFHKGFFLTIGKIADHVFVGKRICDVIYNPHAKRGSGYSYWDEEVMEPIHDAELLEKFFWSYDPIAKLLAAHLGCSPTPEIVIPNRLWNLGAPDMTCEEVYLARNAGADINVKQKIALLKEGMTIYCFGFMPESSASPASICKLRDFLSWDNGSICHVAKLPPSIVRASEAYTGNLHKNLFYQRGQVWDVRYNYGAVEGLKHTIGCTYIAKLLSKPHQRWELDELSPPPAADDVAMSPEEILNDFETGKGRGYKQDAIDATAIRKMGEHLKTMMAEKEDALKYDDVEEAERCQVEIDKCKKYLMTNMRPGGKPKNINKDNDRQSDAIARACKTVIHNIEEFNSSLASHLNGSISYGNNPIYAPKEDIEWHTNFR